VLLLLLLLLLLLQGYAMLLACDAVAKAPWPLQLYLSRCVGLPATAQRTTAQHTTAHHATAQHS
jgi:hypothetical protein